MNNITRSTFIVLLLAAVAIAGDSMSYSTSNTSIDPITVNTSSWYILRDTPNAVPGMRVVVPSAGTYLVTLNAEVTQGYGDRGVTVQLALDDKLLPWRLVTAFPFTGQQMYYTSTLSGAYIVRAEAGQVITVMAWKALDASLQFRPAFSYLSPYQPGNVLNAVKIQ